MSLIEVVTARGLQWDGMRSAAVTCYRETGRTRLHLDRRCSRIDRQYAWRQPHPSTYDLATLDAEQYRWCGRCMHTGAILYYAHWRGRSVESLWQNLKLLRELVDGARSDVGVPGREDSLVVHVAALERAVAGNVGVDPAFDEVAADVDELREACATNRTTLLPRFELWAARWQLGERSRVAPLPASQLAAPLGGTGHIEVEFRRWAGTDPARYRVPDRFDGLVAVWEQRVAPQAGATVLLCVSPGDCSGEEGRALTAWCGTSPGAWLVPAGVGAMLAAFAQRTGGDAAHLPCSTPAAVEVAEALLGSRMTAAELAAAAVAAVR